MCKEKIVPTYSEFTEELALFLVKNECASILVDEETALDVLEILEDDYENYDIDSEMCNAEESDVYILSKIEFKDSVQIILEPFIEGRTLDMDNILIDMDIFFESYLDSIESENPIEFIECMYGNEDGFEKEVGELSKEELIKGVIEEISEGGCAFCNISELYDIAYNRAKRNVARLYKNISEDLLENL